MIRSTTTRGKAFGKSGVIFWIGPNKFNNSKTVGFKTESSEVIFVSIDRFEVLNK